MWRLYVRAFARMLSFFENFDKFDYLCNHVEVIWKSVVVASMSNFINTQ